MYKSYILLLYTHIYNFFSIFFFFLILPHFIFSAHLSLFSLNVGLLPLSFISFTTNESSYSCFVLQDPWIFPLFKNQSTNQPGFTIIYSIYHQPCFQRHIFFFGHVSKFLLWEYLYFKWSWQEKYLRLLKGQMQL